MTLEQFSLYFLIQFAKIPREDKPISIATDIADSKFISTLLMDCNLNSLE